MPNQVPFMIYGTAWKKDQTARFVEQALLAGFRGIDTACQPKHYHEAGVGAGVAAAGKKGILRESLYLQTKFTPVDGHVATGIPYDPNADIATQVRQSFRVSQKNLGTDYVDALVIHSPYALFQDLLSAWKAMEGIYREGGTRRLGISNCYDLTTFKRLYEAAEVKPTIVQNRFYRETNYDKALRTWIKTKDVTYQSFWSLTANPDILRTRLVRDLAQTYQRSEAVILYRYLIQIGIVPLNGTTSEQHMKEDLAVAEFELKERELEQMSLLF